MKVEVPTSLTMYVQWKLHPFESPQDGCQKQQNTKYAVEEAKKVLKEILDDYDALKIIYDHNGMIRLIIKDPTATFDFGCKIWEKTIELLIKHDEVETISVYVNNEISEGIALNLADRVGYPWHEGYQGRNHCTLIYHK